MDLLEDKVWDNKNFIFVVLSLFLSIININALPVMALLHGATGYCILFTIFYIILGIPMAYMESIVGQFTERDCIDVWKIRPCLSHVGYIIVIWQVFTLINNHTMTSFTVYYLLLSFENPIPFFTCGPWSADNCNILINNLTVNYDCVRMRNVYPYCNDLYKTFPEYQFWRFYVLQVNSKPGLNIAWRVTLASGIICFLMIFMCFKHHKSLKYTVRFLIIYPMIGILIFFMGSMQQKGVIGKYSTAIDFNFVIFKSKAKISGMIQLIMHNLGIGSGIMFNLASNSSFRSTCFSNTVVCVLIVIIYTIISTLSLALMTCPYAFEYGIKTKKIMDLPLSQTFEKIPRLIYEFDHTFFYLITYFSCQFALGMCANVLIFYNLLELLRRRYSKLTMYPGLTCLCGVIILFMSTICCLSLYGIKILAVNYRKHDIFISTFLGLVECLVFVMWYGLHRFSEDVHFMLGIQPNHCMKAAWVLANVFLCYALLVDFFSYLSSGIDYPLCIIFGFCFIFFGSFIVNLMVALFKGKFRESFKLDPNWGPKCEVLQRSRGMFSAQAMTKEYMYRQYHLQAGIIERQKISNVRADII